MALDAIVRKFQANWLSKDAIDENLYVDASGEQINTAHESFYLPMIWINSFGKETMLSTKNDKNVDWQLDDRGFTRGRGSYLNRLKK